ncbi:MAG: hypothetical protein IKK39_03300 [Thermoguttaceae bacterium]|nr:hypothetical protein [Thermoguttaceae bacterium]MBR4103073.1 hypothetical protein [Thermoguttaceae bacterium]
MRINVLFPTGTQTVDLDELKELARQGVVQPSTLLETGGQRGKAKNVPALKPIFAELAAAPTQAPEPPSFPSIPSPPEPPRTVESSNVPSPSTPPEPLVFPSISEEPRPLVFPSTPTPPATPRPLDFSQLEQLSSEEVTFPSSIETSNAASSSEPPRFPEVSTSDATPQFPPISPENHSSDGENAAVFPRVASSSSAKSLKAIRAAKLEYWVKWGRGFLAFFDVSFVIGALVYFVGDVFPAIVAVVKAIGEPFYKETLYLCGGLVLLFLLAAFGYGLATILFRILFAATALYAASCEEEARNAR